MIEDRERIEQRYEIINYKTLKRDHICNRKLIFNKKFGKSKGDRPPIKDLPY